MAFINSPNKLPNTLATRSSIDHALLKPNFNYQLTDHSNANGFFNISPKTRSDDIHRSTAMYEWLLFRKPAPWPLFELPITPIDKPQLRPDACLDDWKIWFVGHATVLIQIGSYNFLTDPVWAERASPLRYFGPKRVRAAGIALHDLPRIDAVLLSHNHYDHLDLASLEWLHQRDHMPIYTGLANRCYFPDYMNIVEMDWWQELTFAPDERIKIAYTPAQHFSGRGLKDRNKALWGGLSILTPYGHCFFAGDTGYSAHFEQIKQRYGKPRIALLPIGAYEPRHIMRKVHMNPEDAVQAHLDLESSKSLSIHYRTFQLTDEAMNQPLIELSTALTQAKIIDGSFFNLLEGYGCQV